MSMIKKEILDWKAATPHQRSRPEAPRLPSDVVRERIAAIMAPGTPNGRIAEVPDSQSLYPARIPVIPADGRR